MENKQYLFICGCPRSGTTALWRLLIEDKRLALGIERYGNLFFEHRLSPDLFEQDRFKQVRKGDTFYDDLSGYNPLYTDIVERLPQATFVGDKLPLLYNYFDRLAQSLPGAKILFIIRNIFDVAASYENRANDQADNTWPRDKRTKSAIHDWNKSLHSVQNPPQSLSFKFIEFEALFQNFANIELIYDFLQLNLPESIRRVFSGLQNRRAQLEKARTRQLGEADVHLICKTASFGLYRNLLARENH
jgi:hypothetical protein